MRSKLQQETQSLPAALVERIRILEDRPDTGGGEYVLYWMHHAVRGHENPALDVALSMANRRQLPVVVYQGIGGRHPYNNDRHYTFVMQGASDAHEELRRLGVRTLVHLDPTGSGESPLRKLVVRAALVVVEDFPAPPFPRWTRLFANHSPCSVLAVDCACIVPMQQQPVRFERAYEFRRHNQAEFEHRVPLTWPEVKPIVSDFNLTFDVAPLELESADWGEICARCSIDHSIPPVTHTRGGSSAGYRRWEIFLRNGLQRYAQDRNDAAISWPRGVSRLSPYLHHGHVSPFRIAREAWQQGGEGSAKFLDELLIWRELAFNFCFHTFDPEDLGVLPDWALQTLDEHAADERPMQIDEESLARSRSGDELWDLAQTSLRIHGELHNNLRMTWAKAILNWRPTPQAALDTLIELNHRYALDGCDPNSYGGLLWAMGLFDRPFADAPVTGKLRKRSTQSHARRLDIARYRARVSRPTGGEPLRVAVIGAGISGLTAARTLQDQGHLVEVFEKSRGKGGRAATRRAGDLSFDHGAQYFTARDPSFCRAVDAWRECGLVDTWSPCIGQVVEGTVQRSPDRQARYVAKPGMSGLGRHLAAGLTVHTNLRVAPPQRSMDQWHLTSEAGKPLGVFDALIVSAPAPQAGSLLAPTAPHLAAQAAAIEYEPTWTLLLSFEQEARLTTNALFFHTGPLSWAADNGSKPGRQGHNWVLHATHEWSREHLDSSQEHVCNELTSYFCKITRLTSTNISYQAAHRWLYASVTNPLAIGGLWDEGLKLGVSGDWCQDDRIEGAYLSGQAVAGRLLGYLAKEATGEQSAANADNVQPESRL